MVGLVHPIARSHISSPINPPMPAGPLRQLYSHILSISKSTAHARTITVRPIPGTFLASNTESDHMNDGVRERWFILVSDAWRSSRWVINGWVAGPVRIKVRNILYGYREDAYDVCLDAADGDDDDDDDGGGGGGDDDCSKSISDLGSLRVVFTFWEAEGEGRFSSRRTIRSPTPRVEPHQTSLKNSRRSASHISPIDNAPCFSRPQAIFYQPT